MTQGIARWSSRRSSIDLAEAAAFYSEVGCKVVGFAPQNGQQSEPQLDMRDQDVQGFYQSCMDCR